MYTPSEQASELAQGIKFTGGVGVGVKVFVGRGVYVGVKVMVAVGVGVSADKKAGNGSLAERQDARNPSNKTAIKRKKELRLRIGYPLLVCHDRLCDYPPVLSMAGAVACIAGSQGVFKKYYTEKPAK
jgi:hypothetical protein